MADKKYSDKSSSDSKGNRKSKRSFSKDAPSFSKKDTYKKDDSKPRKPDADKEKKSDSRSDKSFSKFRKDKASSFSRSDKSFSERKHHDKDSRFDKKPFSRDNKNDGSDKPKRSYDKSYFDKSSRYHKTEADDSKVEKKQEHKDDYKREGRDKSKRSYDKSYFDKKTDHSELKHEKKSFQGKVKTEKTDYKSRFDKPQGDKDRYHKKESDSSFSYEKKKTYHREEQGEKRFKKDDFKEGRGFRGHDKDKRDFKDQPYNKRNTEYSRPKKHHDGEGLIRLNKYLANAGISSRRDADTLILGGTVKVNGVVINTLGYKVKPTDVVSYADSTIKNERKVYLLLNKPKDFITTTDDPQERRTVMELVRPACKERIYPVGRLDRNTTGLLLFTNDGDIATKLMHPKHEIKKVYHVTLNKPMRGEDYKAIGEGITLDDGLVKVDDIAFVGEGKKEIGLEIHSGKNRIVRRIFEHLGYEVLKLDRVSYAGLTKKDLPRGKYRFLTDKEISFLKMLG